MVSEKGNQSQINLFIIQFIYHNPLEYEWTFKKTMKPKSSEQNVLNTYSRGYAGFGVCNLL